MNSTHPSVSPYRYMSEERRASARKFSELRNTLGLAFRKAQQEAYESYASLEPSNTENTDEYR